jgi:hypothetical protein
MTENQQLLEHIGKTKTKNLVQDIQNEYFEIVKKTFPKKENPVQNIKANALVFAHKPNDSEIKSIGMSCINDLINDNFAKFWGGIISRTSPVTLNRLTGGSAVLLDLYRQADSFADTNGNNGSHALGCQFAIGSGVATPLRTDTDVQTIIQSIFSPVGNAGWNSGLGQVQVTGNSAVLIGSGSISETGFFGRWFCNQTNLTELFLQSHDLISPSVNFVNGDVATVEYTFQL